MAGAGASTGAIDGAAPASTSGGGVSATGQLPIPEPKNVAHVRELFRNCYEFTRADGPSSRTLRAYEIHAIMGTLKSSGVNPALSVLQQNLMYLQNSSTPRQQQPQPQAQPQAQAQTQMAHHGSSSGGQNGPNGSNLSAMPPGSHHSSQSGYGAAGGAHMQPSSRHPQTQAQLQDAYKRKLEQSNVAPGGGGGGGTALPNKVHKNTYETSAAEQRTRDALEQQARHHGTHMTPPLQQHQHQQQPAPIQMAMHTSAKSKQINGGIATGGYDASAYRGGSMSASPPGAHMGSSGGMARQPQLPLNNMPLQHAPAAMQSGITVASTSGSVQTQLTQRLVSRMKVVGDQSLYLDPVKLVQKVGAIVSDKSDGRMQLQATDEQAAMLELMALATQNFMREVLLAARRQSKRRLDLAKQHLPAEVTSDPKSQLSELQKQEAERRARLSKHREIQKQLERKQAERAQAKAAASGAGQGGADTAIDAKMREEEKEQAALQAKHEAAVAQAERAMREARDAEAAGPAQAAAPSATPAAVTSAEDEYVMSLIGGGATTMGSTPVAAPAAPAFASALPPSTFSSAMPPSSFSAGGSARPAAGAATSVLAVAPSVAAINLHDILALMEAHPHLRRSSRVYQTYLQLSKKRDTGAAAAAAAGSAASPSAAAAAPSPPPPSAAAPEFPPPPMRSSHITMPLQHSPPSMLPPAMAHLGASFAPFPSMGSF